MPNNLLHDALLELTADTIMDSRDFLFSMFRENQNLLNEKNDDDYTPFDLFTNLATAALGAEILRSGDPEKINPPFVGGHRSALLTDFFSTTTGLDAVVVRELASARKAKYPAPKPENFDLAIARRVCFQIEDDCGEAINLQQAVREKEMIDYLGIERIEEFDRVRFGKLLDLYPTLGQKFINSLLEVEEARMRIEMPALDILKEKRFLLNGSFINLIAAGFNDAAHGIVSNPELSGLVEVDALSAREYFQNTALHLLAAKNWKEKNSDGIELRLSNEVFAEELVCNFGADPNLCNDRGHTALDIAVARRSEEMVLAICKSQKLTGETIKKALEILSSTTYERALVMVTQECLLCCEHWQTTEESEASLSYKDQCLPLQRADYSVEKSKKLEEILKGVKLAIPSADPKLSREGVVDGKIRDDMDRRAAGGGGGGGGGGR
jgi:hypothetical protein